MKYLRKYNEALNSNIVQNIEDILQDLKDDEFYTKVIKNDNGINISIAKKEPNEEVRYLLIDQIYFEIKDYILQLIDYLKSESYVYYYFYSWVDDDYNNIEELEDYIKEGTLGKYFSLSITFLTKKLK